MNMMKSISMAALAAGIALAATPASAAWVFVGSWSVGDGPNWTTNPPVYSGQEAAALLFGGAAGDYAISTLGEDPALINFRAQVDGWGDVTYLFNSGANVAQDYSLDTGGSGYDSNPGTSNAFSAYVQDHSSAGDPNTRNFAFRDDGAVVPEPATWAMLIIGFGLVGVSMRRRSAATA